MKDLYKSWVLFAAAVIWPVMYDTMYAMVDRTDDIKIGVKSTAIIFGEADRGIIAILQLVFLALLYWCGILFSLNSVYHFGLIIAAGFFVYQQWLIRNRQRENCFQAFLNNHWVGMIVFAAIAMSYQL